MVVVWELGSNARAAGIRFSCLVVYHRLFLYLVRYEYARSFSACWFSWTLLKCICAGLIVVDMVSRSQVTVSSLNE